MAEFKRSWLNDPGRAVVAVSAARLVAEYPSAIRHTAIERPRWILFVKGEELSIRWYLPFAYFAVLGECCRPEACDGIPPMGGVSRSQVQIVATGTFKNGRVTTGVRLSGRAAH